MTREIDADFPVKLQFLFRPHRYKIARGGRWSGKSWGFARALLIIGIRKAAYQGVMHQGGPAINQGFSS
jgi:hypothetical protein